MHRRTSALRYLDQTLEERLLSASILAQQPAGSRLQLAPMQRSSPALGVVQATTRCQQAYQASARLTSLQQMASCSTQPTKSTAWKLNRHSTAAITQPSQSGMLATMGTMSQCLIME